jgi:hypothetical protein
MAAAGLQLGAAAARFGMAGTTLTLAALLLAVSTGNVLAFTRLGLWLNLLFPLLALLAVTSPASASSGRSGAPSSTTSTRPSSPRSAATRGSSGSAARSGSSR